MIVNYVRKGKSRKFNPIRNCGRGRTFISGVYVPFGHQLYNGGPVQVGGFARGFGIGGGS